MNNNLFERKYVYKNYYNSFSVKENKKIASSCYLKKENYERAKSTVFLKDNLE